MLSGLWEVRACFDRHFQRPARFLVAEDEQGVCGLLPLSWIEESGCYGCFPGESWQGRTWLEQNRIPARGYGVLEALLDACPLPHDLRYLLPLEPVAGHEPAIDEVGYLFNPPRYEYDLENYFQEFSHRSAKRIKREVAALEARGVRYRYDELSDFEHIVRLNIGRFGDSSYFHDLRFERSFRSLMHLLHEKGWLRMTAVLINDEPAAVDMGCVYGGTYTLLAGGTHGGHAGVAKLINLHHMRRACEERLQLVDFLCGDFSWKQLFHLQPRPLYLLASSAVASHVPAEAGARSQAHDE
jgi:hypothetical protein